MIPIVDNHLAEGTETFRVILSEPSGGASLASTGEITVSITDTDLTAVSGYRGKYAGSLVADGTFSGAIVVNVGANGMATGSILWAGRKLPFKERIDETGHLQGSVTLPGGETATLRLTLGSAENPTKLTGSLTVADATYPLELGRELYHPSRQPFPGAGRYSVVFSPVETTAGAPMGHGYAVIQISKGGTARIVGALADGTKVSHSATAQDGGLIPFLAPLYKGGGRLAGQLAISASSELEGSATWLRPETATKRQTKPGFTSQLQIIGSPLLGNAADAIPAGAHVVLSTEHSAPVERGILGVERGKFRLEAGPDVLSLQLNQKTGVITGKFRAAGNSAWAKIGGILLQNEQRGAGFMLLPGEYGGLSIGAPE